MNGSDNVDIFFLDSFDFFRVFIGIVRRYVSFIEDKTNDENGVN